MALYYISQKHRLITGLLTSGATLIGTGVAVISGAAAGVIGSAGIFGTTVGASGLTGMLMSAGIISFTPIWLPLAAAGTGVGFAYATFRLYKLRKKVVETHEGQEAHFTEWEAKLIDWLLRKMAKSSDHDDL